VSKALPLFKAGLFYSSTIYSENNLLRRWKVMNAEFSKDNLLLPDMLPSNG
jgi:hypothetical protein